MQRGLEDSMRTTQVTYESSRLFALQELSFLDCLSGETVAAFTERMFASVLAAKG